MIVRLRAKADRRREEYRVERQETKISCGLILIVAALAGFYIGQATSSRFELYHPSEARSSKRLLDKRSGTLYGEIDGKWEKDVSF